MKTLKDSILEKLNIDNVKIDIDFPEDLTLDIFINYLKERGFKEKPFEFRVDIYNDAKAFNKYRNKCYELNHHVEKEEGIDYMECIFADTSKSQVRKDNPIFYFKYNVNSNTFYRIEIGFGSKDDYHIDIEQDEFIEKVKKYFRNERID